MNTNKLRQAVKERYGKAALRVKADPGSCCGDSGGLRRCNPVTGGLYQDAQTRDIPSEALQASLGCGNPTALAELHAGETVLDLGSGGGIDVLLSGRRVGPTGKVYGLDRSDEMLVLARQTQRKAGMDNVEFLKGEIEAIPLPDNSVDVIISNCVINLSTDKDQVLNEAFRVLRPGGRLAVSDIVVRGRVPSLVRRSIELWIGCLAGALSESEYRANRADEYHDWAVGIAELVTEPLLTCEAVLAEAAFHRFDSSQACSSRETKAGLRRESICSVPQALTVTVPQQAVAF